MQLAKELKEKAYTPRSDPFMPRLQRKIGHQTGEMSQITSTSQRNTFSAAKVSHYENNTSL